MRDRAPVPAPQLVRAVDAYVGPPREPAVPHRAPGWLRVAPSVPGLSGAPVNPSRATASRPRRPGHPATAVPDRPAPAEPTGHPPGAPAGTGRRTLGQSRRLGLGPPTSRPASAPFIPPAPVDPQPPPASTPAPEPEEHRAPVPYDLARDLRSARAADVSAVTVRRGPVVDSTADRLQARAYASDEEVFLPTSAGELTTPEARALLAHELVHVTQQRELGTRLPGESTPGGELLEADALAAEHAVRASRPLPPPPTRTAVPNPPRSASSPVPGRLQRAASTPALVHPARPETTAVTSSVPGSGAGGAATRSSTSAPAATGTGSPPAPASHPATPAQPHPSPTPQTSPAERSSTSSRDEANPTTWSEFGEALRADAVATVFEGWAIDPDVHRERTGGPGTSVGSGPSGTRASGAAAGPGGTSGTSATGFDRARRRTELRRQALALLNAEAPAGQPEITELADRQERQIERQLDDEQAAAGGPAMSSDSGTRQVTTWADFGGELRLGLADLAASPWGVDLAADEISGRREGRAGGGRSVPAAPTEHAGVGPSGRPLIDTDDLNLDELAGRLYDRVRTRLRLELLLDRERAGMLTDFR